jgi:hypothetical protein
VKPYRHAKHGTAGTAVTAVGTAAIDGHSDTKICFTSALIKQIPNTPVKWTVLLPVCGVSNLGTETSYPVQWIPWSSKVLRGT